jgi:hypothetical protein
MVRPRAAGPAAVREGGEVGAGVAAAAKGPISGVVVAVTEMVSGAGHSA